MLNANIYYNPYLVVFFEEDADNFPIYLVVYSVDISGSEDDLREGEEWEISVRDFLIQSQVGVQGNLT